MYNVSCLTYHATRRLQWHYSWQTEAVCRHCMDCPVNICSETGTWGHWHNSVHTDPCSQPGTARIISLFSTLYYYYYWSLQRTTKITFSQFSSQWSVCNFEQVAVGCSHRAQTLAQVRACLCQVTQASAHCVPGYNTLCSVGSLPQLPGSIPTQH